MEDSNQDMPKIIKFLQDDGYELQNIDYNPQFGDTARAIFEKMTHIEEIGGNDINDATITVTVDFDTRFDYKNGVYDEEEGIIYDFDENKAHDFIEKLMDGKKGKKVRKHRWMQ
jgi:outer membrane protein assembly factor BamA